MADRPTEQPVPTGFESGREGIVWAPSRYPVEDSNLARFMRKHGISTVNDVIRRSVDDTEWFWDAAAKDLGIAWFRPYVQTLDLSRGVEWARWYLGGKLNIVHNCLERHMKSPRSNHLALLWEGEDGSVRKLTYAELGLQVNKFANGLKSLGVNRGDAVGIYMPMTPEVVVSLFACLKIGAMCVPIFSGFGARAVATRLLDVGAKVLITSDGSTRRGRILNIKKEADSAASLVDSIKHKVVFRRFGLLTKDERDVVWDELVDGQSAECPTEWMDSEDVSLVLYSSGTTGKPKGTVHTHAGALIECAKDVGYHFDLKRDDVFCWVTDIGWMMGPWMLIGCLHFGAAVAIFEGAIDYPAPDRMWNLIERFNVAVFGVSPTVIRVLMRYGDQYVAKHRLSSLRVLGSTGEPWDSESWKWFFEKVGHSRCPIINISGGTELIGPNVSPTPLNPLKSCTVGGPGLGMDVDVFDEEGKPVRGRVGYLVMKKPCPSMTKGFWKDPRRYLETYWSRWPAIWYHADLALVDDDGFWYILGRADDVIKVAGKRIGPSEVESGLVEHPSVSEAAAVGVPDKIKGEQLVCVVVLQPGCEPSESLREELRDLVSEIFGKPFRPKEVRFVRQLPKTRSGKVVRKIIRSKLAGEKGVGDLSVLENPEAIAELEKAV